MTNVYEFICTLHSFALLKCIKCTLDNEIILFILISAMQIFYEGYIEDNYLLFSATKIILII